MAELVYVPPEQPDPEVRARPATPDEVPRAAQRMRDTGLANGWSVYRQTYARGPLMGGPSWKVLRIVDSLVLSLMRDEDRLIASWVDGKFTEAWHYIPNRALQRRIGSREAYDLLKGVDTQQDVSKTETDREETP